MNNVNKSVKVLSRVIDVLLGSESQSAMDKTRQEYVKLGYYLN
jgi:hypothetical protein